MAISREKINRQPPKELPRKRDIRSAADILERGLKPQLRQQMEEIISLAEKVFVTREKSGEIIRMTGVERFEQATFLIGLAAKIKEDRVDLSQATTLMRRIYPFPNEVVEVGENDVPSDVLWVVLKQLLQESDLLVANITDQEVKSIMRRTGQQRDHMVNEISATVARKSLRQLIESRQIVDADGGNLIVFPMTYERAKEVIQETYQQFASLRQGGFKGICSRIELSDGSIAKVVMVFSDCDGFTLEHEKAHRDNPGLAQYGTRIALEEMMADLVAEQKMGSPQKISYRIERRLLLSLSRPVRLALLKRFQDGSLRTAAQTASVLINEYGLSEYLDLNLLYPLPEKQIEGLNTKHGLIATETFLKRK